MTTRFIHTADWQLGKPFAGVEDVTKRALLQQERIGVVHRIAAAAQAHDAAFVVVAGDVFDSPGATKMTVSAACAAIGAMARPVFVIPGNHDCGGPGSVWEQPFFLREQSQLAPNLRVLLAPELVETDSAVLLPCPLLRRHEASDTTAWLRALEIAGDKPRIVIAHGSIQGFGAQDDSEDSPCGVNQIDLTRLGEDRFDYIALGDWHGTKQVGPKAWYAGTPEPDRFSKGESNEPGHVLAVTASRGAAPEITRLATAHIGWHQAAFEFAGEDVIERLGALIATLTGGRAGRDLLQLELSGTLGIDAASALEKMIESWQARFLRVKLSNRTRLEPSPEEIESLTQRPGDPVISRVAARLFAQQAGDGEDAAIARTALRELHALLS